MTASARFDADDAVRLIAYRNRRACMPLAAPQAIEAFLIVCRTSGIRPFLDGEELVPGPLCLGLITDPRRRIN